MSQPIVFISHSRVKESKLDGLVQLLREAEKRLEAEKPRTLASLAYLTNDAQVTIFHIFADADSFDIHVQGAEERLRGWDEFVETPTLEIYGKPSDLVLEAMGHPATSGAALSGQPEFIGGFLRLNSGRSVASE